MADALKIKFDASGLNAALDAIAIKSSTSVRPAAQAGAQVYYNEMKSNVSRIGKVTGNLGRSIYQVFSKSNSYESKTSSKAVYHISWNHKVAPHGHLVEFGHLMTRKAYIGRDGNWYTSKEKLPQPKQVGARPFVRPAFDTKSDEALTAARDRWVKEMQGGEQ